MIVRSVLERAKWELLGGQTEPLGGLSGAITSTSDTIYTLTTLTSGALVELDYELVQPYAKASNNPPGYYVWRGVLGSTATAHADGTMLTVNPRFPFVRLLDALRDELAFLCSPEGGMWTPASVTLPASAYQPEGWYDVSNVPLLVDPYALDGDQQAVRHYDHARKRLYAPRPSGDVTFHYRAEFGPLSAVTFSTDLTTLGVPSTAETLLVLGVQVRMLTRRAQKRAEVDVQQNPRVASDVPSGAVEFSMRSVLMEYERARRAEVARLERQWPRRRRTGG